MKGFYEINEFRPNHGYEHCLADGAERSGSGSICIVKR
jgi:hypothetical protein